MSGVNNMNDPRDKATATASCFSSRAESGCKSQILRKAPGYYFIVLKLKSVLPAEGFSMLFLIASA